MSFDLEFVKYSLTRRFVCKRNSLAYPGRNGLNRKIRDTRLNRDNKSFISLGPIVSAQRVNFPPVSSDSGIQLYVRFRVTQN
jgi:hypothetical protein